LGTARVGRSCELRSAGMAMTDRLFGLAGSKPADASELIPGAIELEQALFDGRLLAFRWGQEGSCTWIPARERSSWPILIRSLLLPPA
jgi:hypothetical protein